MNKRLNKFYFCSAKYWKGKIRSRLNDIIILSISFLFFLIKFPFCFSCFNFHSIFLFFLIKFPFCFSCFNFHSILYRFNDLLYRLNDIIGRLNEIFFAFDFRFNFFVSISFLINIGKEMSLPVFRTLVQKYIRLITRSPGSLVD